MSSKKSFFLKYLQYEKIKLDFNEFYFQLETHPDYPSLLAYHDTLNFFNVDNVVIKIKDKDHSNLPDYFVAEVNSKLSLVKKSKEVFKVDFEDNEISELSLKEFQDAWSGIVLVAENNEDSKQGSINPSTLLLAFSTLVIILTSVFFSFLLSILLLLILFGIFLATKSIQEELNIKTDFSSKFCNFSKTTDCSTIINSEKFKILNFFSLSDLSIVFFIGQLILFFTLVISNFENDLFFYSFVLMLISLPLTLASIYYQWQVAKKWCVICLLIIFVLYSELIICFIHYQNQTSKEIYFSNISMIILLFSFLITLMSWLIVKPFLVKFFALQSENKLLFKFKRNYSLFKNTLVLEKKITYKNLESGILIGKKSAKLRISIITNPYCSYCKDTHLLIEELLKKYADDILINLSFFFNPDLDNDINSRRLHFELINIYMEKGEIGFMKSLGSWFSNKNHDKWFASHKRSMSRDRIISDILKLQYNKNIENNVLFTPSIFIGEYNFPSIYEKKDIKLYIEDLLEDKDIIINN